MNQAEILEHNINCPTDKRTEHATKKVPNPTPAHKIFDGVKPTNKKFSKSVKNNKKENNTNIMLNTCKD